MDKAVRRLIQSCAGFFAAGLAGGYLYPFLGPINRQRIEEILVAPAAIETFNLFALVSIGAISLRVWRGGLIVAPASAWERFLLCWLPMAALTCCVPFFSALSGFILGHPPHPELTRLAIFGAIGFLYSAGILLLILFFFHERTSPLRPAQARHLGGIAFVSFLLAAIWYYGAEPLGFV